MELVVNGAARVFQGPLNLLQLLDVLELKPDRTAIELNRQLVPRANWPLAMLEDGDELEIVQFVGGG
jgi:sulfur carrier protein